MSEAIAAVVGLILGAVLTYTLLRNKVEEMRRKCISACKQEAVSFFASGEWEARVAQRLDGPAEQAQG